MNLDLKPPASPALRWRGETPLKISVKNKSLCPRYTAIAMAGLKVGSSPWWMQERLARVGIRPINSLVDITNYVMLELGQPLHAFDRQKTGDSLVVRTATAKESLRALDGKVYELSSSQLVIADDNRPIALAGIMGGEETGVTEKTTSIILECATFDPVNIRRTSRALNISSDAAQLFEKGLSSEAPTLALARAVELVIKICGGKIDGAAAEARANSYQSSQIKFALANIPRLLGVDIPAPRVKQNLERLGFGA